MSRNTPRYALAVKGSDGCESLLKNFENEKEEVVGSVKGKGIVIAAISRSHGISQRFSPTQLYLRLTLRTQSLLKSAKGVHKVRMNMRWRHKVSMWFHDLIHRFRGCLSKAEGAD